MSEKIVDVDRRPGIRCRTRITTAMCVVANTLTSQSVVVIQIIFSDAVALADFVVVIVVVFDVTFATGRIVVTDAYRLELEVANQQCSKLGTT